MFQAEFHPAQDMPRQMRLFVEDNEEIGSQKDADYIEARCQAVREKVPEIDRFINDNTQGWNTARMGKVELAALRLAIYEMRFDDDIPTGVAIDEAVEIAKKYLDDEVVKFINGILGSFVRTEVPEEE